MERLFDVDWAMLFRPETPLLELLARGTVIYLSLFLLLRLVLKRERGTVAITDLLMVVLLADAAQNGLTGDYQSITDGVILVATIIFWNYFLDWLGFYIPAVNRLITPPPLLLVEDGQLLRHNLRREFLAEEELMSMLRQQGIEDVGEVKKAYMEGNGQLSVFPVEQPAVKPPGQRDREEGPS